MNIFFIAGAQRSGTTLLSVMLGRHSSVDIDGEALGFRLVSCFSYYKDVLPYNLPHSWEEIQSWLIEVDYKGRLKSLLDYQNLANYPHAQALIAQGISRRLKQHNKTVFGDKVPNIEQFVPQLLMLVPQAKFIHVVRDGRAAALSKHKRAYKNLYLAGQEWVDSNIQGLANQAMIGECRYKIVRYEDLLSQPRQTLQELCQFLNIDFEPSMLQESQVIDKEKAYVKPSLDTSKIDEFKQELSSRQIRKLECIQGPLLQHFKYPLVEETSLKKHRQLSVFIRIAYHQVDNIKQLFIGKRMGMIDRENVPISIPFSTRLKTFVFNLGVDFLPRPVHKRLFRKRWIKEVYMDK